MHFCILLDFLCELYYDARIHEHQVKIDFIQNLCMFQLWTALSKYYTNFFVH